MASFLRRVSRPLRHALLRGLLGLLRSLLGGLPVAAARGLGRGLGSLAHGLAFWERRKVLSHLSQAFPGAEPAWIRSVARGCFRDMGVKAAEFLRLPAAGPRGLEELVAGVDGLEPLLKEVHAGRGLVLVTAHYGNWELMGSFVAQTERVAVVARQLFDPRLEAALERQRRAGGLTVFGRNTPIRPILKWLKEGGILGVLADHDTGVNSLYADFFGHPAKSPAGPAVLAQATGALLATCFSPRQEDGRYRLRFGAPIPLPADRAGGELALWGAVQEYTRRTEEAVRAHPEQWAWTHARWRSSVTVPSPGWDPRLAEACLARIEAWRAAGRPALGAP